MVLEFIPKKNFYKVKDPKNIEDLSNIDGIGDTQISSLKNFFNFLYSLTNGNAVISILNFI